MEDNSLQAYKYIAEAEPYRVQAVLNKYGYALDDEAGATTEQIAEVLDQIVAEHSLPALKDIMDIHPDKEIILDLYAQNDTPAEKAPAVAAMLEKKPAHHMEGGDDADKKHKKSFFENPTNVVLTIVGGLVILNFLKN